MKKEFMHLGDDYPKILLFKNETSIVYSGKRNLFNHIKLINLSNIIK